MLGLRDLWQKELCKPPSDGDEVIDERAMSSSWLLLCFFVTAVWVGFLTMCKEAPFVAFSELVECAVELMVDAFIGYYPLWTIWCKDSSVCVEKMNELHHSFFESWSSKNTRSFWRSGQFVHIPNISVSGGIWIQANFRRRGASQAAVEINTLREEH